MKLSGKGSNSKTTKKHLDEKIKKKGHSEKAAGNKDYDTGFDTRSLDSQSQSDKSFHYASMELRNILHFNEGIDKMNELAAQLHQEFVDTTKMRPGAASAFYEQLVSLENANKYPTYLSHTPDSMFETKHIKFDSPALNPATAAGVLRDPTPEEYAKFLANSEDFESRPSSSYVVKAEPLTVPGKAKRGRKSMGKHTTASGNNSEEDVRSVIHAPEIWTLVPDNSYAVRQNLKDSMVSDTEEKPNNTRRIVNNYYPTKNAFVDSSKLQPFWVHLGIPMPSPPGPFLTSTFLKLNNPHPQSSGLVTLDNGVRRFCVGMNGYSSEELSFRVEGKKIIVTGSKSNKKSPREAKQQTTEEFILPDDLNLHDLQVHRDDAGNVVFEEIWHEPVDTEEHISVLNDDPLEYL